jgi:cell division protein FtsZ
MSTGYGEGENRVTKAINEALNSPLLNNNDIFNSKKVLLNINFCSDNENEALMMEEMNEVNDFMRKFREDVETKWGLATDSSLGNKVKITLLATGFGLQNVPGISEMSEQQSREKAAIEAEEKQKEGERIEMYYGSDVSSPRRRRYVHIFRDDELDNDDIISMVETLPTYRRTKEDLNKLSATKPAPAPTEPAPKPEEPEGILTFNF